ncbi:MAG: Pycsar system effector family protein [Saprospiraceae bacterium]
MKKSIFKELEKRVLFLLENELPADVSFHNYGHTQLIQKEVVTLGKISKLSKEEIEILSIAALFIDTGYIISYEEHEKGSLKIATQYLNEIEYPQEKINQVLELILVPFGNTTPSGLLKKIMNDAYFSYFGLKKFRAREERLRKEKMAKNDSFHPTDIDWYSESLERIKNHTYYSKVAIERYVDRKKINLDKTKARIKSELRKESKKVDQFSIANNKAAQLMFKTSLRNHIDLTSIADQKSNIMLSVNALLLTIGMPVFASYLSEKLYLLVPAIIFMLTCITTMIFATLSTRPIKMKGKTNLSLINEGTTNLFFFGNFYKIDQKPYQEAIRKVIADKERLDTSIINDLYFLGNSLGDKFRFLRICYNVFITGMVISLGAFLVSYFIFV